MAFNYQAIINSINNFAAQHGLTMYAYSANFKGVIEALDNLQNIQFSVQDGTIVNADVNANAAIAGTKIDPNFGSQTVITTGNVGIGTTSPGRKLEVNSGSEDVVINAISTDSGAYISFEDDSTTGDTYVRIGAVGDNLRFDAGNSERMRIDSQGRLNLGVADPGSSAGIFNCDINGTRFHLGFGSAFTNYYTAGSNGNHIFRCGTSEKVRIKSSGNVGIGTTSPGALLDARGNVRLGNQGNGDGTTGIVSTNGVYIGTNYSTTTSTVTALQIGGYPAAPSYSGTPDQAIVLDGWSGSTVYHNAIINRKGRELSFHTAITGTSFSDANERMRIDSSGNVGIGTSSGDARLTVNSSGSQAFEVENSDSSDSKTLTINQGNANHGSSATVLDIGASNATSIITTGNVGIGTSSPDSLLNLRLDNSTAFDATDDAGQRASTASLLIQNENGTNQSFSQIVFDTAGSGQSIARIAAIRTGNGSNDLAFVVEGGNTKREAMRIDSSGNVGIGTTSPGEKLHLAGVSVAKLNLESSSTTGTSGIQFGDPNDVNVGRIQYEHNGDYMYFETNASEAMRIDSSGRLLVGTSSVLNSGFLCQASSSNSTFICQTTAASGNTAGKFIRTQSNGIAISFSRGSGDVGSISLTAMATSYNSTSDHRLKENVVDITDGIARVKLLQPKRFNFIVDAETTFDGFLAHEAQTVVPESVTGTHNEVDDDGNPVMQGIDQAKLVPLLTAALQEAIAKIETFEQRLSDAGIA